MIDELTTLRQEPESGPTGLAEVGAPPTPATALVASFDIAANPDFARHASLGRGLTLAASAVDNNIVVGAV